MASKQGSVLCVVLVACLGWQVIAQNAALHRQHFTHRSPHALHATDIDIFFAEPDADYNSAHSTTDTGHHFAVPRQQLSEDTRIQFNDGPRYVEGDQCTDGQRQWQGVCMLAKRCPAVLAEYMNGGKKPSVCSYREKELVVCCPTDRRPAEAQRFNIGRPTGAAAIGPQAGEDRGAEAFVRPNRANEVVPPPPSVEAPNVGVRKSQQKCDEYSRLATHTGSFTLLSIITAVDKVDIPTCAYPTGLIVGGIKTKTGEFPHMAVIGWTDEDEIKWNCGGSLISEQFVLTAAHCAAVRGVRPDIVRLGEQNLRRDDDKAQPQDFAIADIISHPDYKTSSHYFDIAVIKIDRPVQFTKFIRPACLWQNHDVNSTRAVATGWGQVEFSGSRSDDLLKVPLNIVAQTACRAMYTPSKRLLSGLLPEQLCAGFQHGGKDTCQGDSGGPLQVLTPKNQCIFHIVGVTSFGRACAARNSAGVYTRVSSYLDWLEAVVWPA